MSKAIGTPSIGQLVVIHIRGGSFSSHEIWGVVEKATPATVTVHDLTNVERKSTHRKTRDGQRFGTIREPTTYELALHQWQLDEPKTRYVKYTSGFGREGISPNPAIGHVSVDSIHLKDADTLKKLEQAKAELDKMIAWVKRKPSACRRYQRMGCDTNAWGETVDPESCYVCGAMEAQHASCQHPNGIVR